MFQTTNQRFFDTTCESQKNMWLTMLALSTYVSPCYTRFMAMAEANTWDSTPFPSGKHSHGKSLFLDSRYF